MSGAILLRPRLYGRAWPSASASTNLWVSAQSYKGLAGVALAQGELAAARDGAERGLALYRRMQDRDGMADCLLLLSEAAQIAGDLPAAWRNLEEAEAYIRATENGFRSARALYRRAILLEQDGKQAQAQEALQEALRHPACERVIRERVIVMLKKDI